MRRWLCCPLVVLAGTACGDAQGDDAHRAGLELGPVVYRPAGLAELMDGGPIDLFAAPQGGHVLVVGARARGLDSATVEMTARLVSPEGNVTIVDSTRTAKLIPSDGHAGWLEPDPSNLYAFVHLPVCPDPQGRAIVGTGLRLELQVTELYSDFASAEQSLKVFPICTVAAAPNVSQCECECSASPTSSACGVPN
jgi:hypothetical protein